MTEGRKDDQEKLRVDLLPVKPLEKIAEVLTHGARKYTDRNWEKGIKWGRVYGAVLRHLFAFWKGENLDKDSGLSHLAHAACELLFLLEFAETRKEFDDRPDRPIENFPFLFRGKPLKDWIEDIQYQEPNPEPIKFDYRDE